ncbi:hypothetical protein D3C73_1037850 [compost metagenome]
MPWIRSPYEQDQVLLLALSTLHPGGVLFPHDLRGVGHRAWVRLQFAQQPADRHRRVPGAVRRVCAAALSGRVPASQPRRAAARGCRPGRAEREPGGSRGSQPVARAVVAEHRALAQQQTSGQQPQGCAVCPALVPGGRPAGGRQEHHALPVGPQFPLRRARRCASRRPGWHAQLRLVLQLRGRPAGHRRALHEQPGRGRQMARVPAAAAPAPSAPATQRPDRHRQHPRHPADLAGRSGAHRQAPARTHPGNPCPAGSAPAGLPGVHQVRPGAGFHPLLSPTGRDRPRRSDGQDLLPQRL